MEIDVQAALTAIASVATVVGSVYMFLRNFKADIGGRIDRLDADVKLCMVRLDGHASRIDQLYQMFVDLLKENKK